MKTDAFYFFVFLPHFLRYEPLILIQMFFRGFFVCAVVAVTKPLFFPSLFCFSPSEELSFGSGENEKKCLIILSNVTKNQVAFKVIVKSFHSGVMRESSHCRIW